MIRQPQLLRFPSPALAAKRNDPRQSGSAASKRILWGIASRFCTYAVHGAEGLQWVTRDAHSLNDEGASKVIRLGDTLKSVTSDIYDEQVDVDE